MKRGLLILLTASLVTGCGLISDLRADDEPSATQVVEGAGVAFEVPSGWAELDAGEVFEGGGDDDRVSEFASRLGVTPDQLVQTLKGTELLLFSDDPPVAGFVDNVNVIQQPGPVPDATQVEAQLTRVRAELQEYRTVDTDAGLAVVADYMVDVGTRVVQGRGIFLANDAGTVGISVSSTDPDVRADVGDRILETLQPT